MDVHPSAWIAPTAVLTGDVAVGAGSRVLHCAVLNGATVEAEVFVATGVSMFPGSVYGVPHGTSMLEIMRRQSEAFGPGQD